jgi:hypothetical protein
MDDAPFREWCGANKVLWPKLAVGSAPGTGRGVLATEAIHEGEVVVEVGGVSLVGFTWHHTPPGDCFGLLHHAQGPCSQRSCVGLLVQHFERQGSAACRAWLCSKTACLVTQASCVHRQVPDDAVLMAENCSIAELLAGGRPPPRTTAAQARPPRRAQRFGLLSSLLRRLTAKHAEGTCKLRRLL